ncbi:MAG: hypothetical protein AB7V04_13710 [Desulfomonilaceae bacterium]
MKSSVRSLLYFTVVSLLVLNASTAMAASEGGTTWTPWLLLWRVINTLALVALLVYFIKKPLVTFFRERKANIARELEEAKEKRDEALRLIEDYKTKLAGMEQELAKMTAELKKAAESDSQKVVLNAEKLSSAMIESAKLTAEQEVRKARILLKNEAVELAVTMAEALIKEKINDQDRKRIVEDYLVKVGGMK